MNMNYNEIIYNSIKDYEDISKCNFLNSLNNKRLLFLGLGPREGKSKDFIHILIVFSSIKGI